MQCMRQPQGAAWAVNVPHLHCGCMGSAKHVLAMPAAHLPTAGPLMPAPSPTLLQRLQARRRRCSSWLMPA